MRLVVSALLIIVIVALSGCGHVSGNYPVPKKRPPQLPEQYENRAGEALPVVWERPGEVRVFGFGWRDPSANLDQLRQAINAGQRQFEPHLRMMEPIADDGYVLYTVAVFVTKEATLEVPLGRVEVFFSDGSTATDLGAFFAEQSRNQVRYRDSRNKKLNVQSKYATAPGTPIMLAFILPAEHLEKPVSRLNYVRD
ncbi:MAG: hypothetical protein GY838_09350 [bacterium]|nr:hypothetical protein [bacterium]